MYKEIDERQEQVSDAHEHTFRWIFREYRAGFLEWLQYEEGIYWVNGKPASGKSTLMKYIVRELRTGDHLTDATGKPRPLLASFWFWTAGSELQKSLSGLYRSLLHEILKNKEQLCRVAFPEWRQKFSDEPPTLPMLSAAMTRILAAHKPSENWLFVIDGLDEFEGTRMEKTDLADRMLKMAHAHNIRMIVSSRPEACFEHAFRSCYKLRLEDLTERDIQAFILSKLTSNPDLPVLTSSEKDELHKIEDHIHANAQGVFLWVTLMCNEVVDSVIHKEDAAVVRTRISKLPRELDGLFTHILTERIHENHRVQAYRCLAMALQWRTGKDTNMNHAKILPEILTLGQKASTYVEACVMASIDKEQFRQCVDQAENQLKTWCQGLLECVGGSAQPGPISTCSHKSVVFLHRSLFEYLQEREQNGKSLKQNLGEHFDVFVALISGIGAYLINSEDYAGYNHTDLETRSFFHFNTRAEHSTGRCQYELITAIDRRLQDKFSTKRSSDMTNGQPVHWTHRSCSIHLWREYPPGLHPDLLSTVVETGGNLFLEDAIKRPGAVTKEDANRALGFQVDSGVENVRAMKTLLRHGADPTEIIQGYHLDPWRILLRALVEDWTVWPEDWNVARLEMMHLLASHAGDRKKCRELEHDGHTAPSFIRQKLLKTTCCSARSVKDCNCVRAQRCKAAAKSVLELIGDKSLETSQGAGEEQPPTQPSTHSNRWRQRKLKRILSRLSLAVSRSQRESAD